MFSELFSGFLFHLFLGEVWISCFDLCPVFCGSGFDDVVLLMTRSVSRCPVFWFISCLLSAAVSPVSQFWTSCG